MRIKSKLFINKLSFILIKNVLENKYHNCTYTHRPCRYLLSYFPRLNLIHYDLLKNIFILLSTIYIKYELFYTCSAINNNRLVRLKILLQPKNVLKNKTRDKNIIVLSFTH